MTQGHGVVVVLARRHVMTHRDLAETERLIAYTLINASAAADVARNPQRKYCCLFDLSGAPPWGVVGMMVSTEHQVCRRARAHSSAPPWGVVGMMVSK